MLNIHDVSFASRQEAEELLSRSNYESSSATVGKYTYEIFEDDTDRYVATVLEDGKIITEEEFSLQVQAEEFLQKCYEKHVYAS